MENAPPIATAIMATAIIEIELEDLLQRRLPRKDEETWRVLTENNGPLSTLYSKIMMGYALNIYDEHVRDLLHIVRNVRNAFAHSKKLIDFDNDLIVAEIRSAPLPKKNNYGLGRGYRKTIESIREAAPDGARYTYLSLIWTLSTILIKKETQSLVAQRSRVRKKVQSLSGANRLFSDFLYPQLGFPKGFSPQFPPDQTGDLNPEPTGPYAEFARDLIGGKSHKRDK